MKTINEKLYVFSSTLHSRCFHLENRTTTTFMGPRPRPALLQHHNTTYPPYNLQLVHWKTNTAPHQFQMYHLRPRLYMFLTYRSRMNITLHLSQMCRIIWETTNQWNVSQIIQRTIMVTPTHSFLFLRIIPLPQNITTRIFRPTHFATNLT